MSHGNDGLKSWEEMMNTYEIAQIYGCGPFGHAGATQVFVTETIQEWLSLASQPNRRYDPEGIIHDLFVMCPIFWSGHREIGAFAFAAPRIMDRLERSLDSSSGPNPDQEELTLMADGYVVECEGYAPSLVASAHAPSSSQS